MPKFRKKPVLITAEQWFPGKHVEGVTEIVHDPGDGSTVSNGYGWVTTAHNEPTKVVAGDWIIPEPDGRGHYPCKPDIFEATYEPAGKHEYWGAGDPDCPRDIKAPNGELHTLRCKLCGLDGVRGENCAG